MLRLLGCCVLTVCLASACGNGDGKGDGGVPQVRSAKDRACSVTVAFPNSEQNPAPLAQKAEEAVQGMGPFPPEERSLVLALGSVAESARNAAQIQEDAGDPWATTLAGERVLTNLRAAEADLTAACR